tara:strand:- start:54 stop:356 length:303 start_codon:yes stop_codon:yes gene_type:complete
MFFQTKIATGDRVFVEAIDDFYKQFLHGWFTAESVVTEKGRFTLNNITTNEKYKMFRNRQGICCVVEHDYNRYGESTWDSVKEQHRFIFVPVDMYVKLTK